MLSKKWNVFAAGFVFILGADSALADLPIRSLDPCGMDEPDLSIVHVDSVISLFNLTKSKSDDSGDGSAIQFAIDECFAQSKLTGKRCRLRFSKDRAYFLDKKIQRSNHYGGLVLSGSNAEILGCGATIVNISRFPSFWGDSLDVVGLIPGKFYPQYRNSKKKYHDSKMSEMARDVTIRDLNIVEIGYYISDYPPNGEDAEYSARSKEALQFRNCVGVAHAENIRFENVRCINAPQTSFAVVSSLQLHAIDGLPEVHTKNLNIVFDHVTAEGSGQHAYRFLLMEGATHLTATLSNSSSTQLRYADNVGLAKGVRAHLIYSARLCDHSKDRARLGKWCSEGEPQPKIADGNVSLKLIGNSFDDTGSVLGVRGIGQLEVLNNRIDGGFFLKHLIGSAFGSSKAIVEDNIFGCEDSVVAATDLAIAAKSRSKTAKPILLVGVEKGRFSRNRRKNGEAIRNGDICLKRVQSSNLLVD